jgi:hypothetical protein
MLTVVHRNNLFLYVYRATISHHSADVDAVTYDVIGPQYEVIKKGKGDDAKAPPSKERNEFTLSKCAAYGPVATSQGEQRGNQSAEYEVVQTTSSA